MSVKLMSKKAKPPREAPKDFMSGDPYIDARNAWLERYGTYIQQAYNWRLVAMLEAVGLIAAVVGLIYISTQTKLVPYVVAVDKVGMAFAVAPADRAAPVDERVVRAELSTWIQNARTVLADGYVQLQMLNSAYAFVDGSSPAKEFLDSYYQSGDNSPFKRARKQTVQVAVNAIQPINNTATSYEVQWTETVRDDHGHVTPTSPETWSGIISFNLTPPTEEATILRNPLGLYITAVSWQKKL